MHFNLEFPGRFDSVTEDYNLQQDFTQWMFVILSFPPVKIGNRLVHGSWFEPIVIQIS